jgi:hypothetical protein
MTTDHVAMGNTPAEQAGTGILGHLDLWAEKGLITAEEVAAIREFESSGGEGGPKRIAPILQALLYMGTALTLAALGTIYWQLYEDLGQVARVVTPAVLAAVLAGAGWFTARRSDPDVRRFGGVLWLLSTGAFAGFLSELVTPDEVAGNWSLFLVGAGAAVWAGVLAMLSPQATTQIGLFGSAVAAVAGLAFGLTDGFANEGDIAWVALPIGLLGVGWIVAGRSRMLRPAVLADVLGGALVLYAPTLLFGTNIDEGAALLLGSVIAGGLLGASAWLRSTALLAVGAVGLYAYSFGAIWVYFGDTIGMPVVLLSGGLLLLAIAFGAIRLGSRRHG